MEPKILTFLYCLHTGKQKENGPIDAFGILPFLSPEFVPGMYSFSVVFGVVGIQEDKNHILGLQFKDPQGKVLIDAPNVSIQAGTFKNGDNRLPAEATSIMLSMDLQNIVFETEGMYMTSVSFDGKHLGDFEIYVKGKRRL